MYRAGLLAILLLATTVLAGNATLTCTVESSSTADTTDYISVSFKFESIAPVFLGQSIRVTNNLIYSPADYAQWDKQLEFKVILEHYAPNQSWRIDWYKCVYNDSGNVEVGYYNVLAQDPERKKTTITFTVPATAARYSASTSVKVSKPLSGTYCSSTPTLDSWPNCPTASIDPNKVTVEYPSEWQALQVNGRRPGDVVKAYGVNATIPDPWEYGIDSDVETFSYVEIDGSRYSPDVSDAAVESSVYLYMVGMPKRWGTVKVKGDLDVPLYVVSAAISTYHPTTFCIPPSCFVLGYDYDMGVYVSLIAKQSGINLHKTTALVFDLFRLMREIRLPLGSVYMTDVRVEWGPGGIFDDVEYSFVIVSVGTPFFRVINDATYYEEIGKKGKLNGPLKSVGINNWWAETKVAFAVDTSAPSFEFDMYTWPLPAFLRHKIYPPSSPPDQIVRLVRTPFGPTTVFASAWLTDSLKRNHPNISNGRYVDLLRFLYGHPATYYWGAGDQYGMVSVRTEWRYESTTADPSGQVKLYYVTGTAPTSVAALNMPWPVTLLVGPWFTSSSSSSPPPNNTPPPPPPSWLVWLVPTAACRTMFCTSLSPEVLGPLLPFPGDRALPNMGYSFMLMYIGSAGRHRVKVYVEDGYVISSGPPINISRARNYKLVEIDKEWKPFETVVIGPGWWVPYRSLKTCSSMPVRASSIYTTPDWLGPVRITVEDNGRNSTYVFYVTNDVGYRITTRTPAPASLTATPFNITAYITLDGLPYYHAVYGYGEGGRLSPPACASTWYDNYRASQLFFSGDFWGSLGLANTLLRPVSVQYIYTKPRLELADPWRGLVRVRADGPVAGFAFYAQRDGAWVKIGEAAGSCLLVNASRLFPWDPILVLPLVGQELDAAPGSTVAIWRPETALLFKTWADVVGYPKGARSVLAVVRRC